MKRTHIELIDTEIPIRRKSQSEEFNILNHPNDLTYIGVISSPFFGQAVAALPPRRMQLDVEFKF